MNSPCPLPSSPAIRYPRHASGFFKHIIPLLILILVLSGANAAAEVCIECQPRDGGFHLFYTDLERTAGHCALEIRRYYNSASHYDGIFGPKWGYNYGSHLVAGQDGSLAHFDSGSESLNLFVPENWDPSAFPQAVAKIAASAMKIESIAGAYTLDALIKEMRRDAIFRTRMVELIYENGKLTPPQFPPGQKWISMKKEYDEITKVSDGYLKGVPGEDYELYDEQGRLIKKIDRNGNETVITYRDASRRILEITDNRKRSLRFSYNDMGLVKEIKSDNGLAAVFTYDKNRRLTESRDARGELQSYGYDINKSGNLAEADLGRAGNTKIQYWGSDKAYRTIGFRTLNNERLKVYTYDLVKDDESHTERTIVTVEHIDVPDMAEGAAGDNAGENGDDAGQADLNVSHTTRLQFDFMVDGLGVKRMIRKTEEEDGIITETAYAAGSDALPAEIKENEEITTYTYDDRLNLLKEASLYGITEYAYHGKFFKKPVRVVKIIPEAESEDEGEDEGEVDDEGEDEGEVEDEAVSNIREYAFAYDAKGNLVHAKLPDGNALALKYDSYGKLCEIFSAKKQCSARIEMNALDKPILFEMDGIGSVAIKYDEDGNMSDIIKNPDETHVSDILSHFLGQIVEISKFAQIF